MIPEEKREAVERALAQTFHTTELDEICRIPTGYSLSLVFRIVVRGKPYLLKIITRADDPTRHYTSMRAAADAGLAPHVCYANVDDKISITEFVGSKPFTRVDALARLPGVLRRLHELPSFGRAPFNTTCTFLLQNTPVRTAWLDRFKAANALPDRDLAEFLARFHEIAAAYPAESDLVSCHNDLFKPDNILFDGERVWLVDWEAAFLNDRYAELAVVANQLVTNEEEEIAFLRAYFDGAPIDYQLARLHLMRQIAHLFYTTLLLFPATTGTQINWNEPPPEFADYQRQFWTGELRMESPQQKITFARVHWNCLLHNVRQPRYQEALRTVRERWQAP